LNLAWVWRRRIFTGHGVNLPWGTSKDEIRHRLEAVLQAGASLPKKVQATLKPLFEPAYCAL
jgi:hypothetical protein